MKWWATSRGLTNSCWLTTFECKPYGCDNSFQQLNTNCIFLTAFSMLMCLDMNLMMNAIRRWMHRQVLIFLLMWIMNLMLLLEWSMIHWHLTISVKLANSNFKNNCKGVSNSSGLNISRSSSSSRPSSSSGQSNSGWSSSRSSSSR